MTLWLKTRRAVSYTVVMAGVVVTVGALGDLTAPVPALIAARGLQIPVALLAPLALSIVVGYGLTAGDRSLESVAVRPIHVMDTAYVLVAAGSFLGAAALLQAAGQTDLGLAAGRNSLGFAGLLLIGRAALGGNAAPLVPVANTILFAFFGADPSGEPRWWAWMVTPQADELSWLVAVLTLAAGVSLSLVGWRSRYGT